MQTKIQTQYNLDTNKTFKARIIKQNIKPTVHKISANVRDQAKFAAGEFGEAARNQIHLTAPRDRAPRATQ